MSTQGGRKGAWRVSKFNLLSKITVLQVVITMFYLISATVIRVRVFTTGNNNSNNSNSSNNKHKDHIKINLLSSSNAFTKISEDK